MSSERATPTRRAGPHEGRGEEADPEVALHVLSGCDERRIDSLCRALAQAGVELAGTAGEASVRLLCFDADATSELLAGPLPLAARTIAVRMGTEPPAAAVPWSLIEAGASDVIDGRDAVRAATAIAARLQRWREVDACLELPAVQRELVGTSAAWRAALRQVVEIACFSDRHLLVIGESGTGKELIARLVHTLDRRDDKRELVLLDCTTIHQELSGSEFFGHERGAYTGAALARDGAFALADRGTLFLDEVGELPPTMQAQLLRVVQERQYKRLGGTQWQRSAFRLVCATHRRLDDEVQKGTFRADLFYRIAACRVQLPPLCARRADIAALAQHFLAGLRPEVPGFDPAVVAWLEQRDYPGNVRELRQLVERLAVRHVGPGPISVGDVPPADRPPPQALRPSDWRTAGFEAPIATALAQGAGLREISAHATAMAIRLALASADGNLQRAARSLGVTDRALQLRRANGELAS